MQTLLMVFFMSFFSFLFSWSDFGPKEDETKICNSSDYEKYLLIDNKDQQVLANKEFQFWNTKWEKTPEQYPYLVKMASAQNDLFKLTGDLEHLSKATDYLEKANELSRFENPNMLRSLSRNYISEHQFQKALKTLKLAEDRAYQLEGTYKMLFDVHMEIGNYDQAKAYLNKIAVSNSFDYVIRMSKWADHSGDLEGAIMHMNTALEGAYKSKNQKLIQWTITNLADYYGHQGEIAKSYEFYLKALEIDPSDAYAKKGLAWIAFSNDRNPDAATAILKAINKYHNSPDYLLLHADIAEFEGKIESKEDHIDSYFCAMEMIEGQSKMYAKYNSLLLAEHPTAVQQAIELAMEEIESRPTAQSYSLLANAYAKSGAQKKAEQIVSSQIIGKTFEPEPLLIAAQILKSSGQLSPQYEEIKSDLLGSIYELGPLQEQTILNL